MNFLTNAAAVMNSVILDGTTTGGSSGGGFDIIQFLKNGANYVKEIGHYLMVLAGVILVIVAVVQIAKGLAGGGRGQVNWVMSILCLLVGGMLIFGGWNLATSVAGMGKDTLEKLGTGGNTDIGVSADGGSGAGGSFTPTA